MREGVESIVYILNKHEHGVLYFGVLGNGDVVGQDISEKTLRDVSRKIGEMVEPRICPQIERLETPEGQAYVRVEFSGVEAPYAYDGRYRIRSSDENLPMRRTKLEKMLRDSANRTDPLDGRSSGKTVDAVDEQTLREYVERGVERERIPHGWTSAIDVLSRLGLLCEDGTLTNASAVLFVPSRDIMLEMGVFADSEGVRILNNQQVGGTLFSMVATAKRFITNNTHREFAIDGTSLQRREVPEIPTEATREALYNAFEDRSCEDNATIQLDIFWDRVDIYNPGLFPTGFGPDSYLEGAETSSKPRNKLIAGTLLRSDDIETYGTGLQRIRRACESVGVPFEITESRHGDSRHVRPCGRRCRPKLRATQRLVGRRRQ